MTEHDRRSHRREEHGDRDMIAMSLWGGPRTLPEIKEQFMTFVRHLGFFIITPLGAHGSADGEDFTQGLALELEKLTLPSTEQTDYTRSLNHDSRR